MTDNLLSAFLTPDIAGKIASAAGLDGAIAQKAVSAAVPTLLSGLADLAGKPGGARQLANAVADQPADVLTNIASRLTDSAQLADKGTNVLSSLLGGGALGMLIATLSKFLGASEGSMRTLLGLLTPVIMGVLGRQQRAADLDANGLARMLMGRKDDIAAAMPSGLGRLLEGSGIYESIGQSASSDKRPHAPSRAAPQTVDMQRMASDVKTGTKGATWPYWALPLLAVGALLWFMLPSGDTAEPIRTVRSKTETTLALPTKSIYLMRAPENWLLSREASNEFVNHDVYNRAGEKLGAIKDVLLGPDGKTAAVIINIGQHLGMGDKDVAVHLAALQVEQKEGIRRIMIDAVRENLQAAPAFEVRHVPMKQ